MKKYWSIEEVAEQLAVSPSTIYGLVSRRQLGHVRIGGGRGTIRISDEQVDEYVRLSAVSPSASSPPPTPMKKLKHIKCTPTRPHTEE